MKTIPVFPAPRRERRGRACVHATAFVVVFLAAGAAWGAPPPRLPEAREGVVDLRAWRFDEHGPAPLDGEWEFISNRLVDPAAFGAMPADERTLIPVPAAWGEEDGLERAVEGTYRLTVLCREPSLALEIPPQGGAVQLFVAGRPILPDGAESRLPGPVLVSLEGDTCPLELVAQVSADAEATRGLVRSLELGTPIQLVARGGRRVTVDALAIAGLLLLGLYHVVTSVGRSVERLPLTLGLTCLALALRLAVTGEVCLARSWPSMAKACLTLEHVTTFLVPAIVLTLVHELHPPELARRFVRPLQWLGGALALLAVVLPVRVLSFVLIPWRFVVVVALVVGLVALGRAVLRGRHGAWLALCGALLLAAAVVHDALTAGVVVGASMLGKGGLTVFAFAQAAVLERRRASTLRAASQRATQLTATSAELEQRLEEQTAEVRRTLRDVAAKSRRILEQGQELEAATERLERQEEDVRRNVELTERLRTAEEAGGRLLSMLLGRRELRELEEGRHDFEPRRVNVLDVARRVALSLGPLASSRGVDLIVECDGRLATKTSVALAWADGRLAHALIASLVADSLDESPKGGRVTVSVQRADEIAVRVHDLRTSVVDADSFFEDGGTAGGAGLGRRMSRLLAEAQEAGVSVTTSEGEGTAVVVTLRAAAAPEGLRDRGD